VQLLIGGKQEVDADLNSMVALTSILTSSLIKLKIYRHIVLYLAHKLAQPQLPTLGRKTRIGEQT
jgi:hypothetical protein